MLSINEIKELIKIVDHSSVQRFEIEDKTTKIVIVKSDVKAVETEKLPSPATILPKAAKESVVEPKTPEPETELLQKIISPIVGNFYSAAEPGADALVKIGQTVQEDTIVCVLESMKLFNEVESGVKGEIVEILAKDGEFVEYGQPLFLVKPTI